MEALEHFIKSTRAVTIKERLEQIKMPKNRRAFTIIILLFMFMQLSGLNIVILYMEIIIRKAMVMSIAPSSVVMIINTIGMRLFSTSIMSLLYLFYIILLIYVYVWNDLILKFIDKLINLALHINRNIYSSFKLNFHPFQIRSFFSLYPIMTQV